MRVAVVGAGVSGLVTAQILCALGDEVSVYESRPDIGGVWSATRRYPGLGTQSDKISYSFSGMPMPEHYPDYPSSEQVQAYLAEYARTHGLDSVIQLSTTVLRASPRSDGDGWDLQVHGPAGLRLDHVDWLIMANGICSLPHIPELPGREGFETAGGQVLAPSQVTDAELLRDRDVVVIGWGKSAADLAVAALPNARSITMVVRRIDWKLPHAIGRLTFQQLLLTRVGEYLFYRSRQRYAVIRQGLKALKPLRQWWLRRLERTVVKQQQLERRGLRPVTQFNLATHLITPGFFEALDTGAIDLRRAEGVSRLLTEGHQPAVELADGSVVRADLVICATGFDQDLSILSKDVLEALLDRDRNMRLYRHTVPAAVPRLAFVGWHNTFRSPLTAEVQALWVGAHLHGLTEVSARERRQRDVVFRLSHAHAALQGRLQFDVNATFLDLDLWIHEAGLRFPLHRKLAQLVRPMNPAAYGSLLAQLQQRVATEQSITEGAKS